jgi:hypothetical protein
MIPLSQSSFVASETVVREISLHPSQDEKNRVFRNVNSQFTAIYRCSADYQGLFGQNSFLKERKNLRFLISDLKIKQFPATIVGQKRSSFFAEKFTFSGSPGGSDR